jgi:hypothetical protein
VSRKGHLTLQRSGTTAQSVEEKGKRAGVSYTYVILVWVDVDLEPVVFAFAQHLHNVIHEVLVVFTTAVVSG